MVFVPQIELPTVARSGSQIRRVSANVPLKEQIASLASEGFLPAGEIAFWRESSGTPLFRATANHQCLCVDALSCVAFTHTHTHTHVSLSAYCAAQAIG